MNVPALIVPLTRPIALRAVADAEGNACDPNDPTKGVRETAGNNLGSQLGIYKHMLGYNPNDPLPWCAIFGCCRYILASQRVNDLLVKTGETRRVKIPAWFPTTRDRGAAACATYKRFARRESLWHPVAEIVSGSWTPRRGDIVIFDWDGVPGNDHFGIVRGYDPATRTLSTIEGNTTPTPGVSRDSNRGDGVWCKSRTLGQLGVGGGIVQIDF